MFKECDVIEGGRENTTPNGNGAQLRPIKTMNSRLQGRGKRRVETETPVVVAKGT